MKKEIKKKIPLSCGVGRDLTVMDYGDKTVSDAIDKLESEMFLSDDHYIAASDTLYGDKNKRADDEHLEPLDLIFR